jgi:hypothetical protein
VGVGGNRDTGATHIVDITRGKVGQIEAGGRDEERLHRLPSAWRGMIVVQ